MCVALGSTPPVNACISLRNFDQKESGVFRYNLWIYHHAVVAWVLHQRGGHEEVLDGLVIAFFDMLKSLPENKVRVEDFIRTEREFEVAVAQFPVDRNEWLETFTNVWTISRAIFSHRLVAFQKDLEDGFNDWTNSSKPELLTLRAARRCEYLQTGDDLVFEDDSPSRFSVVLNATVCAPHFGILNKECASI